MKRRLEECRLLKIIKKYGGGETRYIDIAKKMAEISLEGDNHYTETDYNKEFVKRVNTYQSYLNSCDSENVNVKPKVERLSLMSEAIGCSREELELIFYSKNSSQNYDNNENNYKNNDEPVVAENSSKCLEKSTQEESQQVNIETQNSCIYTECGGDMLQEEHSFKCLVIESSHIYFENGGAKLTKRFEILCLEEGLQKIEGLDFYHVKGKSVKINMQDQRFKITRERGEEEILNHMTLEFYEPLQKGEITDFTLEYESYEVDKKDAEFGSVWILHPTDWLKIDFTPPNPRLNQKAKLLRYNNRGDYDGLSLGSKPTKLGDLFLDESGSFKAKIEKPFLHAVYKVDWSDNF